MNKHLKIKRCVIIFIIIFIVPPLFNNYFYIRTRNVNNRTLDPCLKKQNLKSSKISDKIYINGNSGWADTKTIGLCTGSGTYSDPYIIEDLIIDAERSGTCISIYHSDVYFIIQNCTLFNATAGNRGVFLYDTTNGQIINNIIFDINGGGIDLTSSYNNLIKENMIESDWTGIGLIESHGNRIVKNILNDLSDGVFGIHTSLSNNNNISENIIYDNVEGIHLETSDKNIIISNSLIYNNIGIKIVSSKCNRISDNEYIGNAHDVYGVQDDCPRPFPIEIVIAIILGVIIVVSALIITILIIRRRSTRKEVIFVEKPKRGIGIEPKSKSELIQSQKLEKLDRISSEEISQSIHKEVAEITQQEQTKDELSTRHLINYCPFCGNETSESMVFCPQCGTILRK